MPPTAHWLAVLSPLSEWCGSSVEVLFPSLLVHFGAVDFPSSLSQSKVVAVVTVALADEFVPWIVAAVGEVVHSVAAVPGFAVEVVLYPVVVFGLAAEGLVLVSTGYLLPAHFPLHFGPAACSLHTEGFLSAQIVCCSAVVLRVAPSPYLSGSSQQLLSEGECY